MFSQAEYRARTTRAQSIAADLIADGVRFVEMQMPDLNGTVRGKIATVEKGLSASGTGVSTLLMSPRSADDLTIDFWSDLANGFPKMVAVPDYDTVTRCPWRPDTAAVLCEYHMEDDTPCPLDARQLLRGVVAEYGTLGLDVRCSVEWEFYLYEADDDLLDAGRYLEQRPFGRTWDFYSITKTPSFEPFAKEYMSRLLDSGIEVEAFHTEYGHGMFEFTCAATDPVKAGDDAARAKLYLKQLATEWGLVATFMPALHLETADSHNGAHHNLSLWRDGTNAMWDATHGELTGLARQFAAGLMATMADLHVVFRPWITSHRRLDRMSWAPEDASWGLDSHLAGLRVVTGAMPSKSARIEHRAPGPDINPYLSLLAILGGGLHGIRHELEPAPFVTADPFETGTAERLPRTLRASAERLRDSAFARGLLGDVLVDHLAIVRLEEADAFAAWAAEHGAAEDLSGPLTQWELDRYFVWC